jgi:hypothetical protein
LQSSLFETGTKQMLRPIFLAAAVSAVAAGGAQAASPYDGRWSLTITTTRGDCSVYNFPVEIINGRVSFPGLVRAGGRVTPQGRVQVNVAVTGKSARGSGQLTIAYGSGRWSGRAEKDRCSGSWTAQRQ